MKKAIHVLVLLNIFMLGFGSLASAYKLDFYFVQHRKYEDGRERNRLAFAIRDDSDNYVDMNVYASGELIAPDGKTVTFLSGSFDKQQSLSGIYDFDSGLLVYDPTFYFESSYSVDFLESLEVGTYKLKVVDIDGISHEADYQFNKLVDLPFVSSNSFAMNMDRQGNLTWTWSPPPSVPSTLIRSIIDIYQGDKYVAGVTINTPTELGYAIIPSDKLEQIKSMGDRFELAILFRTKDNNNRAYSRWVEVDLDNARIAHFQDVAFDYWSYDNIEKLLKSGITTGCGNGNYCTGDAVTRAQMAVFLERGIQGSDFTPPSASGIFEDVPIDYWAAGWIEQFYQDGITKGCDTDPLSYCPEQEVTRAEMAVFLLRAKYGRSYSPPKAAGIFTDVPTNYWAVDWIEQLYAEGITTGCGESPLRFCPDDSVTRDQMAAFLVRTFGLE